MTDLAGARVLITGGAGVVGSTLVDALTPLALEEIVVFDDFSRGLHENLASAAFEQKNSRLFEFCSSLYEFVIAP